MKKSREERFDMEDINNKSEKFKGEDVQQRHLPDDVIIEHLLPYLPIKTLTQFKVVSKHWYSSLSSPNFILNYTKKPLFSHSGPPIESLFIQSGKKFYLYSCTNHDCDNVVESAESSNNLVKLNVNFDADKREQINLVGSSNGLVCLGERKGKYFILYNPATNQSHKYLTSFENFLSVKWGFGYVTSLCDFKLVGVTHDMNSGKWFCVYSLKSNTWKKIKLDLYGSIVLEQPKLVNETLYWKAVVSVASTKLRIIAYDLALDTFELFPHMSLPPRPRKLCVMGGCLSKYAFNSENELVLDILKRPGDVVSVRFSCQFNCSNIHDLIGFTKNGKIIVVLKNPDMLALVDSSSTKRILTYKGLKRLEIDSYVPSQISPHPQD